jgi:hypothetical protein
MFRDYASLGVKEHRHLLLRESYGLCVEPDIKQRPAVARLVNKDFATRNLLP